MRSHIFVSYSHSDKKWLGRLDKFLRPLGREQKIISWNDTSIKPTNLWSEEIVKALNNARVAILLISANFFASDFIYNVELPALLKSAEGLGTKILPVIIGASRFDRENKINQFQAANDPAQPLESLSKYKFDRILQNIANIVEDLFAEGGSLD